MWTDATSPLGYAANTSVLGFKGWSSQRRQLSSNIKLEPNTKRRRDQRCLFLKRNLLTKLSNLLQKSYLQTKNKNPAICCFSTIAMKTLSFVDRSY